MPLFSGSLAAFDEALQDTYARFVGYFPGSLPAFVQHKFATTGLFPDLGWGLIGSGVAEAMARNDAARLHDTFVRFTACAHAAFGTPDEQGVYPGGCDHCSLLWPALHSAVLGRGYLASAFACERPLSVRGYAAYCHAVNAMACLDNPAWDRRDAALDKARAYLNAKGKAQVDKAFVGFFVALAEADRAALAASLEAFAGGFLKSDWGRYKPLTKPAMLLSMVAYAGLHLEAPLAEDTLSRLLPAELRAVWQAFARDRGVLARSPFRFGAPLAFLNDGLLPFADDEAAPRAPSHLPATGGKRSDTET